MNITSLFARHDVRFLRRRRSPVACVLICLMACVPIGLTGCQAPNEHAATSVEAPPPGSAGAPAPLPDDAATAAVIQPQPAAHEKGSSSAKAQRPALPARLAQLDRTLAATGVAEQQTHFESDFRHASEPLDAENYRHFADNPVRLASDDPVSTFSVDVDTAAYSNVRRLLNQGRLPRQDAVRVEEMINYFAYDYPVPASAATPFTVVTEMGPSPWHPERSLLHVGIQGYQPPPEAVPPANLVFLVDVSGSMQSPDKIGLLKTSLKLLTQSLRDDDRIAIAVYAGAAGTVLESTPGNQHASINAAIDQLTAGGSTNGAAGIRLAYALAAEGYIDGGINRVILATDGDFNVGMVDQQALKNLVEEQRNSGVALSVLGFGGGNYNDALMQELSQIGNGNAAYIDNLNEARKVLIDERSQTLQIIAKDVKIQLEFNPRVVAEYRLIGYETRALRREDFNNDAVDAGDIGAGHTVTALYEIALTGSAGRLIDPLRYAEPAAAAEAVAATELGFLKLRYKMPQESASRLISRPLLLADMHTALTDTSDDFRFAAAVAAFGQLLRSGQYMNGFDFERTHALALAARGTDSAGYRGELLGLLRTAQALSVPVREPLALDATGPGPRRR